MYRIKALNLPPTEQMLPSLTFQLLPSTLPILPPVKIEYEYHKINKDFNTMQNYQKQTQTTLIWRQLLT